MRMSMRLRFIISVAAGFLCGDLIAAAQTYSPNYPYGLQPNPAYGRGFSTEDYYLPGAVQGAAGNGSVPAPFRNAQRCRPRLFLGGGF